MAIAGWPEAQAAQDQDESPLGSLPDYAVDALREHFVEQDLLNPPVANQLDIRPVCSHPDGRPYSLEYYTAIPGKMARRFGLRRIRFHDFRHTYATLLLEAGVSLNRVMALLGHSKIETTARLYGHITPVSDRRAQAVLNDLLGPWYVATARVDDEPTESGPDSFAIR